MNLKVSVILIVGILNNLSHSKQNDVSALFNDIEKYDPNSIMPIEIAAVGRVSNLGDLYDARSDTFLQLSLFNSTLKKIDLIENRGTRLQYTLENTYEEKFRTLDISAELKLSILGGLFDLKGSGRFFKDTKTSARSAKASMVHSFQTSYEKMSITDGTIRPIVNFDVLQMIDATHVVVGIQWGGNVFITVEDANADDQDIQTVEGKMGAHVKMLGGLFDVSGEAKVNISETEKNELSKFSFELYGDILPESVPQNIIDAIQFMHTAPSMLQKANNGKGKAMSYQLLPVGVLKRLWNLNLMANTILKTIDEATVKNCVKLFDDINKVSQKVNDLVTSVEQMEPYLETAKVKEVKSLQQNYDIYQSEIQQNLSESLIKVRSGSEDVNKLHDVLTQSLKDPYSPEKIDLTKFEELNQQMSFIKLMIKLKVTMLTKNTIFQQYLWENFDNDIYILFYKNNYALNTEKAMNNFRTIVQNKQNYGPKAIFVAINNEILKENKNFNGFSSNETRISLFKNGTLSIANFEIDTKLPNITSPEFWSISYMQQQVTLMQQLDATMQNELAGLNKNPVPVGFIYFQIASQPEPSALWPMYQWAEVSASYAGQFFRVLGGGSDAFGAVQAENSPRLTQVGWQAVPGATTVINTPAGAWSAFVETGNFREKQLDGIRFLVSGGEVRPRNSAIRVWRRNA